VSNSIRALAREKRYLDHVYRYGHLIEGNAKANANLLDAYLERADSSTRIEQLEAG